MQLYKVAVQAEAGKICKKEVQTLSVTRHRSKNHNFKKTTDPNHKNK